jgi:hypothetical protein
MKSSGDRAIAQFVTHRAVCLRPNQRLLPTNAGSVGSEHGALALLSMKDRERPMFAFVWSVRSRNEALGNDNLVNFRRVAQRTGIVLAALVLIIVGAGWYGLGFSYMPPFLQRSAPANIAGCWRLFDAAWTPAESAFYYAPSIARLDVTPVDTVWWLRSGRAFVATRLDSSRNPMKARRPSRDKGYWGMTALSGKLWIHFPSGFGGPAFRFTPPGRSHPDTLRGTVGEFSDASPFFRRNGHAFAVRVPCA